MNKMTREQRTQILHLLCEGSSVRAVSRITGSAKNAIIRLMIDAGKACWTYHDEHVRNLKSKRIQCDEIWSFVYAKEKNVATAKAAPKGSGDAWTWTALDDSKLIVAYYVGDRSAESASALMENVAGRLTNRIQLTTDGHRAYLEAVETAFGSGVDYAMLQKIYGSPPEAEKRYSPAECIGCERRVIEGKPDPRHISTSFVERSNLTVRMHNRRFTRLTNGFSKKLENHAYSVALFAMYYNFCKLHRTLRVTPAMEATISGHVWDVVDIVKLVEDAETKSGKRGSYKTKAA
jgi:IS1 family transposase